MLDKLEEILRLMDQPGFGVFGRNRDRIMALVRELIQEQPQVITCRGLSFSDQIPDPENQEIIICESGKYPKPKQILITQMSGVCQINRKWECFACKYYVDQNNEIITCDGNKLQKDGFSLAGLRSIDIYE